MGNLAKNEEGGIMEESVGVVIGHELAKERQVPSRIARESA